MVELASTVLAVKPRKSSMSSLLASVNGINVGAAGAVAVVAAATSTEV